MNLVEKKVCSFVNDYMDYLKQINDNFKLNIFTSDDEESRRDNAGWYQYNKGHIININVYNLTCVAYFIEQGIIDIDTFFALITLCVGHEYRHFGQGTCIYDGKDIDGFTKDDAIAAHLMMYIRYFFDAYYLLNKGHIKYELDAEKFGVTEGVKFLSHYNSDMDPFESMKNAVNFYAEITSRGFGEPTLPRNSRSYEEIIKKLDANLENNDRDNNLRKTLRVHLEKFYQNHIKYGLNEKLVITDELLEQYKECSNGFDKDLLVANRILELLVYPEESLEQFSHIKALYNGKRIVK